jgi:hypothetical protein
MTAARDIREEFRGKTQPMTQSIKMNQVITDVPFGAGTIEAHMDSSTGEMEMELGHLSDPRSPSPSTTPPPRPSSWT